MCGITFRAPKYMYFMINSLIDDCFICEQIYFQDLHGEPELKIPSASSSPIIDPHISPDGTKLAYVKGNELNVLDLIYNKSKQLTSGAKGNIIVRSSFTLLDKILSPFYLILPAPYIQETIKQIYKWFLFRYYE